MNFDELLEHKLEIKYKALLELEKGKSNKEVAKSFAVPANTLSTWKKSKDKVFEAFQNASATTKRLKVDTYDQVNKAVLKWFTRLRSKNVPVPGVLIKQKALYFAKELNSIRWLVRQFKEKVGFDIFFSEAFLNK